MNKQINFTGFKSFVGLVVCLLAFSKVFAASTTEQITRSLVVDNLSAKLKNDLAKTEVSVKLSNVKQQKISKNEIAVKGDALALLAADNNQLPIRFKAKINVARKSVSDISYDFVEAASASEYAPTLSEEVLMKTLMKRISKDFNTDNIVIAIDGVERKSNLSNLKEFSGVGEVRIGDLEWSKITFDVVIDENGKASKVVYDVKK
ncbi:MAG TPA: hypothetical protein VNI84_19155 [Pyrinomonadaceae bacterium]|nr:hypothetical protein [Pyrinomonadaceae bacterium]